MGCAILQFELDVVQGRDQVLVGDVGIVAFKVGAEPDRLKQMDGTNDLVMGPFTRPCGRLPKIRILL